MSKINTRSPYFLTYNDANITSAVLDLYIYTGASVTTMDEVMYCFGTSKQVTPTTTPFTYRFRFVN